ncbi:MAG TPA: DUF4160 domain-containing protein [Rhodothermia bacterium]|nr:DUF4160 domain-containing protein [Rhodothermia bacterium]
MSRRIFLTPSQSTRHCARSARSSNGVAKNRGLDDRFPRLAEQLRALDSVVQAHHVGRDEKVAKVWLDPVRLEESGGFTRIEINRIVSLVREHEQELLRSWDDYFTG